MELERCCFVSVKLMCPEFLWNKSFHLHFQRRKHISSRMSLSHKRARQATDTKNISTKKNPERSVRPCGGMNTVNVEQALSPQPGTEAGTEVATADMAGASQGNDVTFQSCTSAAHDSGGQSESDSLARPQVPREEVTLTSTSDSDQSVYYEAVSRLTNLDESCTGPSTSRQGDADTSSSFSQKESDYTSHSFSSSGSSTFLGEVMLNKTVIEREQSAGTFKRPGQEAHRKYWSAGQKQGKTQGPQLGSHHNRAQGNPQSRISKRGQTRHGSSQENRLCPVIEVEGSSSTSDGEPSGGQMQGVQRPLPPKPASGLSSSTTSSSPNSSSSSSSFLTQDIMVLMKEVGEVRNHQGSSCT